jgi:phenylacetate-CoA ligase
LVDVYFCTEFGFLGSTCKSGNLHFDCSRNFFELDDSSNLLVSSIANECMLLPGYRLGDRVEGFSDECSCGGKSLVAEKIHGRSLPLFVLECGGSFSPSYYMHAFKEFSWLEEYQLNQLALNVFELKVETKKVLKAEEIGSFLGFIQEPLGKNVDLNFQQVQGLGHDKFQRFRSLV